jgi:hypothetical protein
MAQRRGLPTQTFMERLRSLVESPEVLRLIHDITACTVEWEAHATPEELHSVRGLELFPCLALYFQHHLLEVKGVLFPNLQRQDDGGVSHLIRLDLAGEPLYMRLSTTQTAVLLSPFHCRFLSMLFGRLLLHHLSLTPEAKEGPLFYTPYSLEEQVVASYLQSLEWSPCATIKLDAQDNPYIGSMLPTAADLRRCDIPGTGREEAIIRSWRLFKRLLYYSIEGERLFTGFAFLSAQKSLDYHRAHWPSLLLYHPANHTPLTEGVQALRQLLLNADGRTTFLAVYRGRIIGLLELTQGTHRMLTSIKSWGAALPLATISYRGLVNFWVALKGRRNPRIPLSLLEYRHGHLHIPLFQDIFWQELERQLKGVCPASPRPACLARLRDLMQSLRRSDRGAIFLLGLTTAQLDDPHFPIENQVRLEQPVPLEERWLPHLLGLAKSDGALIFNDRLEAVQFRARLKATAMHLPPEKDDLGSGIRHQVTREFTAYSPTVVGLCVSQDGHISLYRHGKLISRLY